MKKYTLFVIASFFLIKISGQTPSPIANTFGFLKSFHGTGDLKGFDLNVTKRNKINTFLDWFYGSSLTVHFGKDYAGGPGNAINGNAPMKFSTFGIQGESGITLKLFEKKLPVNISTGPIVRYQSTNRPSIYTYKAADTFYPDALYAIKEIAPNTLSLGYKFQLEIGLMKIRRSRIYFNSRFQNDTHGDVITGLGVVFKNLSY